MAKPPSRLQIAERIHQVLLREIGHAIEVERLVTDARYARDVLLVCDALAGGEARPLAEQFRRFPPPASAALPPAGPAGAPGHARQANEWARDTSGFGVTHPPPVEPAPAQRPRADDGPPGPERRRNWLPRWRE